jgi:drug/metabolite transporter (DMT)-like permease
MPVDLLPPTLAVVVLALASALTWGTGDFLGGITSRRAPLLSVMAVTQLVGVVVALPAIRLNHEALPGTADIGWSMASALVGVIGLGCLYHGLAVGRMGVVAPVAGVLVAGIPVVFGIALQGAPPNIVLIGIAIAILSVLVISRVPRDGVDRPSGLVWGLVAGLTLGSFTVTISRVTPGLVFGPLAIVRTTEAVLGILAIIVARRAWRISRELWPAVFFIGLFDTLGTATYIAAVQIGPLAVAAVLSALYPAMTILLATVVLKERLTRQHVLGILAAGIAVVLIAGGQAGALT